MFLAGVRPLCRRCLATTFLDVCFTLMEDSFEAAESVPVAAPGACARSAALAAGAAAPPASPPLTPPHGLRLPAPRLGSQCRCTSHVQLVFSAFPSSLPSL